MTGWTVEFTAAAAKEIRKLEPEIRRRILTALSGLEEDPRPAGARKLSGYADSWRVRVGDYRALYEVDGGLVVVTVFRVAHRRDVYQ